MLSALGLLGALLLALRFPAGAQQPRKIPRVGLLISASTAVAAPWIDAFRQGMRELGYIEGKNIVLEIRGGEAKPARLSDLAAELVRLKVDIIVAGRTNAVHAVKEATTTIPIVMRYDRDPVRAGVVASLARPSGNITGLASITVGLSGKRFELLAEVVPGVKCIAVLTGLSDRARFTATDDYKEIDAAAGTLGMKLQDLLARDPMRLTMRFWR